MPAIQPGGKSAAAFRTISEVSQDLDVPQHVLRFWESKFSQLRPLKRAGGRRYYRPEDIDLLRRIRELLYSEGYTIKGVQRLLREGTLKAGGHGLASGNGGVSFRCRQEIEEILEELVELRNLLRTAGHSKGGDGAG